MEQRAAAAQMQLTGAVRMASSGSGLQDVPFGPAAMQIMRRRCKRRLFVGSVGQFSRIINLFR